MHKAAAMTPLERAEALLAEARIAHSAMGTPETGRIVEAARRRVDAVLTETRRETTDG